MLGVCRVKLLVVSENINKVYLSTSFYIYEFKCFLTVVCELRKWEDFKWAQSANEVTVL